jgi:hypothetical protein
VAEAVDGQWSVVGQFPRRGGPAGSPGGVHRSQERQNPLQHSRQQRQQPAEQQQEAEESRAGGRQQVQGQRKGQHERYR